MEREKKLEVIVIIFATLNIVLIAALVIVFGNISRSTTTQLRELNSITAEIDDRIDKIEARQ